MKWFWGFFLEFFLLLCWRQGGDMVVMKWHWAQTLED